MPNLLKNLQLEELSLVDRPANAQAMVSLFKRDNSQEDVEKMDEEMKAKVKAYMATNGVSEEEAMKACGGDVNKVDEATEEVVSDVEMLKADLESLKEVEATLRKENERLRKSLIEEGYVIEAEAIEKKAPVETIEVGGEMIVKSDIPTPVLKALEAAEVAKVQHEVEKADIELTKRAGEVLPHFAVEVAKPLLKSFSEEVKIMSALIAADAAFAAAMGEFGKSDVSGEFASANDQIEALVKSYMDTNKLKKSEYAKAYAAVAKTDDGKALINKSYKGE